MGFNKWNEWDLINEIIMGFKQTSSAALFFRLF